jgi:AcrR family transcriptional regulator
VSQSSEETLANETDADWRRRVVGRSLRTAAERSVDRGMNLILAATAVLDRSDGGDITVQEVADEAGQSLRTLYQYFESKDDLLLAVFEETMRTYAKLIEQAISQLDDPLERLAGAIVGALRMPEVSGSGIDRGLVRLRLRLSETKPESVGRAQSAVTTLIRDLVRSAATAGRIQAEDPEAITFMILSLNAAFITTGTIGNDAGVRRPDVVSITSFCLRGLGAELGDQWYDSIASRLQFPRARSRRAPVMDIAEGNCAEPRRRAAKKT